MAVDQLGAAALGREQNLLKAFTALLDDLLKRELISEQHHSEWLALANGQPVPPTSGSEHT